MGIFKLFFFATKIARLFGISRVAALGIAWFLARKSGGRRLAF